MFDSPKVSVPHFASNAVYIALLEEPKKKIREPKRKALRIIAGDDPWDVPEEIPVVKVPERAYNSDK